MPDQPVEFPFEHPAADEARQLFIGLEAYSEADYQTLCRRDRYLWDVCWFETEVMNGGVDQYLANYTGDHAAECLKALEAIGAWQAHSLLKQACDLFPGGQPSADCKTRNQQLRDLAGHEHIDGLIHGAIEVDLYQRMLNYYRKADPQAT
jgi:hypothetical protein